MRRDFSLVPTHRGGKPRRPIEVAMTPMIDVIFLLLVFFVATSSFQLVEQILPSGVAEAPDSESQGQLDQPTEPTQDALEQVVVRLAASGDGVTVTLNDVELTQFSDLKSRFEGISQAKADVPVVIDPDGDVVARDVIQAYDWARERGLSRVFLAVSK